ncbi:MAG: hypothetical protein MI784_13720 [Cytophagales bacterium]|nr:hypothetical protein [Cytophagales bacterium]
MNPEKARHYLKKYWACKLNKYEENELRTFFLSSALPDDLKPYRSLFELAIQEKCISRPVKKTKARKAFTIELTRHAAAVVIFGALIGSAYWLTKAGKSAETAANYTEINDPDKAYRKTKEALLLVSRMLREKNKIDEDIAQLHLLNKYIKPKKKKI